MLKIELPPSVGIGIKPQHYTEFLQEPHAIGWVEIHPENYMGAGGSPHHYLERIRHETSLSMHGVGMSLGSVTGIDCSHLKNLKRLVDRYEPAVVSEHLAWSHFNRFFLNDLLPLPYTEEALRKVCINIDQVQSALGRPILVENPSTYIDFAYSDFSEPEFLNALAERTGCGLLLDVNNVFVSAVNRGFDPYSYIELIAKDHVGEIHLAGHSIEHLGDVELRIDDHGSPVTDAVWELYQFTLKFLNRRVPTLIEWDTDVPAFDQLLIETRKAEAMLRIGNDSDYRSLSHA